MSQLEAWKTDAAVLIVFFCRPAQLAPVFDAVRGARPRRLYLYQDGPRVDRPDDLVGIQQCREIVSSIDWDCDVRTLYQDTNVGCGKSGYVAESWMFETEESGIILEDDAVPSQSFFRFCTELLDRYRDDQRVDRICGMNNDGMTEHVEASYLFSQKGSMCAWATWKRVADSWDPDYEWLNNAAVVSHLRGTFLSTRLYRAFIRKSSFHKSTGHPYHETVGVFACLSERRLMIVPKHNLVANVGVCEGATHCAADLRLLPKRVRRIFTVRAEDIAFPLKHPKYMFRDTRFERSITPNRWQAFTDRLESWLLLVRYGDFSRISRWLQRVKDGRLT